MCKPISTQTARKVCQFCLIRLCRIPDESERNCLFFDKRVIVVLSNSFACLLFVRPSVRNHPDVGRGEICA